MLGRPQRRRTLAGITLHDLSSETNCPVRQIVVTKQRRVLKTRCVTAAGAAGAHNVRAVIGGISAVLGVRCKQVTLRSEHWASMKNLHTANMIRNPRLNGFTKTTSKVEKALHVKSKPDVLTDNSLMSLVNEKAQIIEQIHKQNDETKQQLPLHSIIGKFDLSSYLSIKTYS